MEFMRTRAEDPERLFIVYKNSYSTASLTAGQWCAHDLVTDKDGVGVTKPGGANRNCIAGVVIDTIPHNSYGLVQTWGYRAGARCLGGSGSVTSKITANRPLYFATSGFAAQAVPRNSAALKADYGKFFAGVGIEPLNTAAIATQAGTSGLYEVFIRCM